MSWEQTKIIEKRVYTCGYCNNKVGSDKGYDYNNDTNKIARLRYHNIYICSVCENPTCFLDRLEQVLGSSFELSHGGLHPVQDVAPQLQQLPGILFGASVSHLPDQIAELYAEARRCMSVSSYTSAVMVCRKLLMHIAVEKGAKEDQNFLYYVNWLEENNFIPPGVKDGVNYIRRKGNEANHDILLMEKEDAEILIKFLGMFMKFVYEFPLSLPRQ